MEERIKAMYNDCWKTYKQYLESHNMREWNENVMDLKKKYGSEPDIVGLLFWFSERVQGLHDAYERRQRSGRIK